VENTASTGSLWPLLDWSAVEVQNEKARQAGCRARASERSEAFRSRRR